MLFFFINKRKELLASSNMAKWFCCFVSSLIRSRPFFIELHRQDADLAGMKAEIEKKLRVYYDEDGRWLDNLLAEMLGEMAAKY